MHLVLIRQCITRLLVVKAVINKGAAYFAKGIVSESKIMFCSGSLF